MLEKVSALHASVNDIGIEITRNGGKWDCKISGCLLPKDVHYAQKFLSDVYRGQRKKIAQNFRQSKQQMKNRLAEIEVAKRKLNTAQENQGVNDVRPNPTTK